MTHPQNGPGTPALRRRNAQATQDRLVRAAVELFTSAGYHQTTTPQIARRAGVAEGTIYRHFAGKQVMLNEIFRAGVRVFTTAAAAEAGHPRSARDQLATVAQTWLARAGQDPAVARLVLLVEWGDLLDAKSQDALGAMHDAIGRIVARGKAAGEIRTGTAAVLGAVWFAVVRTAIAFQTASRRPPDPEAQQLVLETAWDAIRARRAGDTEASSLGSHDR